MHGRDHDYVRHPYPILLPVKQGRGSRREDYWRRSFLPLHSLIDWELIGVKGGLDEFFDDETQTDQSYFLGILAHGAGAS
jgi:hypothetical protein